MHLTRLAFNVVKVILRWVRFNLAARSHFVEAVRLWLYRLDDPVPFLLYVVELVCLVLHARVCEYHCILLWLVSDLFACPWLGRTWFLDTVCTLYYHLVPRRAESEWSVFFIW